MIESALLPTLLTIATVTGSGMIVPQVLRIHRGRRTAGVSAPWVGVGLSLNAAWLAYGWAEQLWGIVPVSIGAFVLYAVVAGQLVTIDGRRRLLGVLAGTLIAVLPAAAYVVGGWSATGLVAGLLYAAQFTPATIEAFRSDDTSGVSVVTWAMALVEALIWAGYGLWAGDVPLLIGGTGGAIASALIVVRLATSPLGGHPRPVAA